MMEIVVEIMATIFSIIAIATKELKQGRTSEWNHNPLLFCSPPSEKFLKKLVGERDIEDALRRLDQLTREEAWMAYTEILKITHGVEDKMREIDDKVKEIFDKVKQVIEGMRCIDGCRDYPECSYD